MDDNSKVCRRCQKKTALITTPFVCGKCFKANYCSVECADADWKSAHNLVCDNQNIGVVVKTYDGKEAPTDLIIEQLTYLTLEDLAREMLTGNARIRAIINGESQNKTFFEKYQNALVRSGRLYNENGEFDSRGFVRLFRNVRWSNDKKRLLLFAADRDTCVNVLNIINNTDNEIKKQQEIVRFLLFYPQRNIYEQMSVMFDTGLFTISNQSLVWLLRQIMEPSNIPNDIMHRYRFYPPINYDAIDFVWNHPRFVKLPNRQRVAMYFIKKSLSGDYDARAFEIFMKNAAPEWFSTQTNANILFHIALEKTIDFLKVLDLTSSRWLEVDKETILNCFRAAHSRNEYEMANMFRALLERKESADITSTSEEKRLKIL